jgi:hypothetical protein
VATRPSRGRRARFSLRAIIRGWPWWYCETSRVWPSEILLRTVPNSIGYYTPPIANWEINSVAFEPTKKDWDGISLFRADFVSEEHLAKVNPLAGVRVARLKARDFGALKLSIQPKPDIHLPGHVVIPEMPFIAKTPTPENFVARSRVKDAAQKLAQIASKNKIYTPPGTPDPVHKQKKQ